MFQTISQIGIQPASQAFLAGTGHRLGDAAGTHTASAARFRRECAVPSPPALSVPGAWCPECHMLLHASARLCSAVRDERMANWDLASGHAISNDLALVAFALVALLKALSISPFARRVMVPNAKSVVAGAARSAILWHARRPTNRALDANPGFMSGGGGQAISEICAPAHILGRKRWRHRRTRRHRRRLLWRCHRRHRRRLLWRCHRRHRRRFRRYECAHGGGCHQKRERRPQHCSGQM